MSTIFQSFKFCCYSNFMFFPMDFSGRISKTPIRHRSISLYFYTLYSISFIAPFSNGGAIFSVNLPTAPLLFRRKRVLELCLFPRSKIKYCRILLREFPFFRLQFADICLSLSNLFGESRRLRSSSIFVFSSQTKCDWLRFHPIRFPYIYQNSFRDEYPNRRACFADSCPHAVYYSFYQWIIFPNTQ